MGRLRVIEKTREFKTKRRDRHNKRTRKVRQLEVRKGTQYQSGLGFSSNQQASTEQIPQPITPPKIRQACTSEKEYKKVVFDLETTSRANDAEICQLAAIHGTQQFNVYILPLRGISPSASAVNKLSVSHGRLFYDGKPVTAVQLDVAIQQFLNWLQHFKEPCLLMAHNAKLFDAKHFLGALEKSNKTVQYSELVLGFCDTLPAFKELFPERKSHSQENLAKDLLQSTYNAHNVLNDVQIIHPVLESEKRKPPDPPAPNYSKAISMGIAGKAAASGLSYTHLLLSFH
ncbi:hypothetical protein OS493_015828 [Desmophyllum pertusum]|uniref:Exonuclease domain-containing protein n=1 Tax=Desmophyllum pertusum TaxID=174260 RepID=A0A9W9YCJ2_9CNID|nr:hypothetical protein OS493_015828 [Desmophyllum pertusum]